MGKLFLFSLSIFTAILFFTSNMGKPSAAFAAPLEGIKLRQLESSGCIYKFNDTQDPNKGALTEADGYVMTLDCAPILFFNLIFWALFFAGLIALLLVIFGGFKFMTSGGDQKAVEGAKKTIMWAIIGLAVVLLSFAIVRLIADITGMECLTRFGFIGTCE